MYEAKSWLSTIRNSKSRALFNFWSLMVTVLKESSPRRGDKGNVVFY